MSYPKFRGRKGIVFLGISLLFVSCSLGGMQEDLEEFVDTGLSMVDLRSFSFIATDGSVTYAPSAVDITANLVMVNPKGFTVTYSLAYRLADSAGNTLCASGVADTSNYFSMAPTAPADTDSTTPSFTFQLKSAAEHAILTFTLDMYASAIDRTYEPVSFSVVCDSPPSEVADIATSEDLSAYKAMLAFTAPTETSDDDLVRARITWKRISSLSSTTATVTTVNLSDLITPPSNDPFSKSYDYYFQPDAVAGYPYTFSVVLIDASGQASSAASETWSGHDYPLSYDANGGSGTTSPAVTYKVEDAVAVASSGGLALSGYAFGYWNTESDGSGTSYTADSSFFMPAKDLKLYAQWLNNGTVVSFDLGTQAISFSSSSTTIAKGDTLTLGCGNSAVAASGSGWKWYVDGDQDTGQTTSSFEWTPTSSEDIGQHIISCQVTYNSLSYSGQIRVTVTN
jgi:hypothetical protein